MRTGLLLVLALSTTGCAAVFRPNHQEVKIVSTPPDADVTSNGQAVGKTPATMDVKRRGVTPIKIVKAGYEDNIGVIQKKANAGWLTFDILTCALPVLLCIPLIVDAASGAWKVSTKWVLW